MKVKTEIFPINYLKSIWSPIQAFKNRHQLNWISLIITIIFLNSLMIIPTTINFLKMDSLSLDYFYPQIVKTIDNQLLEELDDAQMVNGKLEFSNSFIYENENGMIAGDLSEEEKEVLLSKSTFILFEEYQFIIKEDNKPEATIFYTKDFTLDETSSQKDLIEKISQQWFMQNKVLIILVFSLLISIIQFVMLSFIVLGSSFILYLTKKSSITSIESFKESVNLIINLISLPTIVSMVYGLLSYNIIWMSMIQTTGLVIMLMIVYGKTNFNDNVNSHEIK